MMRPLLLAALLCAPLAAQDFDTTTHTVAAPESKARAAANAALEAHDYATALKLLEPLAAASPHDARLLYDLGSCQDALDQAGSAERTYQSAIAADPAYLDPRVALGLLQARAGRLADARATFAAAVKLGTPSPDPDAAIRARAYRALARIDQDARPADARDELLAALKLSAETPEDTVLSAELAQRAGAPADAEAAYRRSLAANPNDPEATAGLARLLLLEHQSAQAETLLRAALAAHPGDPALTVQLASAYAAQDQPAQAIPLVEPLHAAAPSDAAVTRLLADLYLATARYDQAEPLLAEVSRANPLDGPAADAWAQALIKLKRYAEAQAVLAPAVAQPDRFPHPQQLGDAAGDLAFAASANNNPVEALRALKVRATVLPQSAPVLFLTAISYDRLRQNREAATAYRAFLAASNGQNPDEEFEAKHRLVALEHQR